MQFSIFYKCQKLEYQGSKRQKPVYAQMCPTKTAVKRNDLIGQHDVIPTPGFCLPRCTVLRLFVSAATGHWRMVAPESGESWATASTLYPHRVLPRVALRLYRILASTPRPRGRSSPRCLNTFCHPSAVSRFSRVVQTLFGYSPAGGNKHKNMEKQPAARGPLS